MQWLLASFNKYKSYFSRQFCYFPLLALLILLTACASQPLPVVAVDSYTGVGKHKVFVVSHGWHTGFVVPAEQITALVPQLRNRFPNAPYIEFGWGDKGFYQAQEVTTKLTVQAIFWPTDTVIHAVAVPHQNVANYFAGSEVKTLQVSAQQLSQLNQFIVGSFSRKKENLADVASAGIVSIVPLKQGIYGDSQFYQGLGSYYLMNTCNKWTAKGLQSIGLAISPLFKLTATSVMSAIPERNERKAEISPQ